MCAFLLFAVNSLQLLHAPSHRVCSKHEPFSGNSSCYCPILLHQRYMLLQQLQFLVQNFQPKSHSSMPHGSLYLSCNNRSISFVKWKPNMILHSHFMPAIHKTFAKLVQLIIYSRSTIIYPEGLYETWDSYHRGAIKC